MRTRLALLATVALLFLFVGTAAAAGNETVLTETETGFIEALREVLQDIVQLQESATHP
jgi:hypothetical protein